MLAERALGLRRLCLRGGQHEGGAGGGDGEANEACGGDAECEDSQPPADLLSKAQGLCQQAWEGKTTLRDLSLLFRQVELTAATREHSTTLEQQYILHIVDTIMQGVAAVAAAPASLSTDHIAAARAVLGGGDGGDGGESGDEKRGEVSEGGVIAPDVDGGGVVALVQDLLARAEAMADAATAMGKTDNAANERNAMRVGTDAAKAVEDAANAVGVQKFVGEFAQGWPASNSAGVNANVANVGNARADAAHGVKAVEGAAIGVGGTAANSKGVTNVASNAMWVTTAAHAMEEEEDASEPFKYTATAPKAMQDAANAMGAKAREDAAKAAYVSLPFQTPSSPKNIAKSSCLSVLSTKMLKNSSKQIKV